MSGFLVMYCVQVGEWMATPEGRTACIILLDQFPRNGFRGTDKMFAFDGLALKIAREHIRGGDTFHSECVPGLSSHTCV